MLLIRARIRFKEKTTLYKGLEHFLHDYYYEVDKPSDEVRFSEILKDLVDDYVDTNHQRKVDLTIEDMKKFIVEPTINPEEFSRIANDYNHSTSKQQVELISKILNILTSLRA